VKTITLGCRFNFYETEIIKEIIDGIPITDDVFVINTCAVTHEAERQSKQMVRKVIRENTDAKVIVTGCASQTDIDYFTNLGGVFKIVPNDRKSDAQEYGELADADASPVMPNPQDHLFADKARAFLQIQNGCNHFCTYCIVPFTRGRSRSMPLQKIIEKVEYFIAHGFREIVLSGIDIMSYGMDLPERIDLFDVISAILNNKYASQIRIRLSSIDPAAVDEKFIKLITSESRIMPHLHLSIQSGDNHVLETMRRRHTREHVLNICHRIRDERKDVVFGCDLIAGFPTENDEMFENTLKLIDEAGISLIHSFPYSPRPGTVAASMVQLPRGTVLERASRLRVKAQIVREKLYRSLVGTMMTSGIVEKCEEDVVYGKTDTFIPFRMVSDQYKQKDIIEDSRIIDFDAEALILAD
jgi:threonylcarbamoyladenosine tRNA methylthiotransferase MtaB